MNRKELTFSSIAIGLVIGIIMTAANVYLGLYAGLTVSASIPAAVIGMGVYKIFFNKKSILETNIIQTMASAGESLAAGVIFTIPALIIVGAWNEFHFWPTTLIAMSGGLLGVLFMIPLRRTLIVEDKELIYPEGVACAQVLDSGSEASSGFKTILQGLGLGFIFKFLMGGLKIFQGSVERAFPMFGKAGYFGSDMSPALLAVGYIVNFEIAFLLFLGGFIGWLIVIPLLTDVSQATDLLDLAWATWSAKIRYIGVGGMLVGGAWSIVSVRKGIVKGLQELRIPEQSGQDADSHLHKNLSPSIIGILFILNLAFIFFIYKEMIGSVGLTAFTTLFMAFLSFIFVAVSSYIVGLVGSSNNPVSGMTICALLIASGLLLVLGYDGQSAILATLGVAAVVCCAACTAADCSQDLKTGYLVQATPRSQQIAQVIGVMIPAIVIAPVLTLLNNAFGIGTAAEGSLKAPQATLFASITEGIFGDKDLESNMIIAGVIAGALILIVDSILKKKESKIRLHLMPIAVGIYLPLPLSVPILIGGVIRYFSEKGRKSADESKDQGVLLSSGLIAGEALTGVLIAILLSLNFDLSLSIGSSMREILSLIAFALICVFLWRKGIAAPEK